MIFLCVFKERLYYQGKMLQYKCYNAKCYNAKCYNAKFYNAKFYNAKCHKQNVTVHNVTMQNVTRQNVTIKKNWIYIRGEFTRKKCKTAILLYCFHNAGVLHIFMLYNLLGPGISFYRKSKINIKRKPNYGKSWIHNWPMIISHRLYACHFSNDDFLFT